MWVELKRIPCQIEKEKKYSTYKVMNTINNNVNPLKEKMISSKIDQYHTNKSIFELSWPNTS